MSRRKIAFAIILIAAYIPILGLLASNKVEPKISGIPFLWVYCALWSIVTFILLSLTYIVDKVMK